MASSVKSKEAIRVGIGEAVLVYVPFVQADPTEHIVSDLAEGETLSAVSGTDGYGQTLGASEAGGAITATADAILGDAQTLPDGTEVGANLCVRFLARAISGTAVVGTEYSVKCYVSTSAGQTLLRIVRVLVEA